MQYDEYIQSENWLSNPARLAALSRANGHCERCGGFARLEVHHQTYENLGCERADDLEALCEDCHEIADDERREAAAADRQDAEEQRHEVPPAVCQRIERRRGPGSEKWKKPRKLRFTLPQTPVSPSTDAVFSLDALEAYRHCPLIYCMQYVRQETPERRNMDYQLGSFVRSFLADRFRRVMNKRADRVQIEARQLLSAFDAVFYPGGELRSDCFLVGPESDLVNKLVKAAGAFKEYARTVLNQHSVWAVAQPFVIRTAGEPMITIPDSIDLVTRTDTDELRLTYWTTGKRKRDMDAHEQLELRRAFGLSWAHREFPHMKATAATVFLTEDGYWQEEGWQNEFWDGQSTRRFAEYARGILMKSEDVSKPSRLCQWCSWQSNCRNARRR